MTINPDLQGRSYPAKEVYDVGREKIREFARAGDPGPHRMTGNAV